MRRHLFNSLETYPDTLSGSVFFTPKTYPYSVSGSILHFFLFRTIPDTVSGLGFSVCCLFLSFHSKFCSGDVHSFYFPKPLRNPTQLDKLSLTISKMAEDTPKDRGNLFENFSQDLDLENEER